MKLNQFKNEIQIKVNEFFTGKELTLTGAKYNEKKEAIVLSVVITKDNTHYDKPETTNLFEKFSITIPDSKREDLSRYKLAQKIKLNKVFRATIYGDYDNNLSMVATIIPVNE